MANEKQDITFAGVLEAGTYTLTFSGDTTSPIAWDDDAAAVQAALEALASIGSGNVSVTVITGGFRVEFVGALANTNVSAISASSSLKRKADTITIVHTQTGIADASGAVEIQRLVLGGATTGTFRINGNSTWAELNASLLAGGSNHLQTAMDSIWGGGAVTVTGSGGGPFDMAWAAVGVRAEQTISDNSTDGTPAITTTQEGVDVIPGRPEIFTATLSDAPTEGRFALNIDVSPSSYVDFDATAAELETALETVPYACGVTGSDGGPWTVTSDSNVASPTVYGSDESGISDLRRASAITVAVAQQGAAATATTEIPKRAGPKMKIAKYLGLDQLTSLSSAVAISSLTIPAGANGAILTAIAKDVLLRFDGTAPSTSAYSRRLVADGSDYFEIGPGPGGAAPAWADIKAIEQGASGKLNVQFVVVSDYPRF